MIARRSPNDSAKLPTPSMKSVTSMVKTLTVMLAYLSGHSSPF